MGRTVQLVVGRVLDASQHLLYLVIVAQFPGAVLRLVAWPHSSFCIVPFVPIIIAGCATDACASYRAYHRNNNICRRRVGLASCLLF